MKKFGWFLLFMVASLVSADEIILKDGSVLKGTLVSMSDSAVELQTSFAGMLTVERSLLESLSVDQPVHVRLNDGTEAAGPISVNDTGVLQVGAAETSLEAVQYCWSDPEKDPEFLAQEALKRSWIYQVSLDVNGSSGNTEKNNYGARMSAVLSGPGDELRLHALYSGGDVDDVQTSEELKGGVYYANYIHGSPWGLYVRQDFEKDEFENIKLRSISASGLSFRFANQDHYKLSVNGGLAYQYERYDDQSADEGEVALDFGLQHYYIWNEWLRMNNSISYVPVMADLGDYLLIQDSSVDFPLVDQWKIRFGLRNDYNSQPVAGREELDTMYYTSLVGDWN